MTVERGTSGGRRIAAVVALAVLAAGCTPSTAPAPLPIATPAPTPTLSPEEAAAAAVLASFDALRQRGDLSYHLSQATTTTVNGRPAGKAGNAIDASGPDFAATLVSGGRTTRAVRVDGVTWTKQGKRSWRRGAGAPAAAATDALDTWRRLGPLDGLAYAGRNHSDPTKLDFTNSRELAFQTTAMKDEGMQGVIDELTLTLGLDGTPVRLRFHAIGSYTSGALADRRVSIDSVIDITRFGEAITVTPPK